MQSGRFLHSAFINPQPQPEGQQILKGVFDLLEASDVTLMSP